MKELIRADWILRDLVDLKHTIEREQESGVVDMGTIKQKLQDIITHVEED